MPRPSQVSQRRAQLIRALAQVMAQQGYEAASIREIAQAAGLAPGLVHHYFPDKEALLVALTEDLGAQWLTRLDEAEGLAPEARLRRLISLHLSVDEARPDELGCWLQIIAEAARRPSVGAVWAGVVMSLRSRLVVALTALAEARGRTLDVEAGAAALLALIYGGLTLGATAGGPPGYAATAAWALVEGLLAAAPSADSPSQAAG
ncbi:MAG: TetR family transcriptional regulator [Deltaproteobacteria bacterium]|nr:TetR family transcriptional regulator [Deltaproteobacteria bacterium]